MDGVQMVGDVGDAMGWMLSGEPMRNRSRQFWPTRDSADAIIATELRQPKSEN